MSRSVLFRLGHCGAVVVQRPASEVILEAFLISWKWGARCSSEGVKFLPTWGTFLLKQLFNTSISSQSNPTVFCRKCQILQEKDKQILANELEKVILDPTVYKSYPVLLIYDAAGSFLHLNGLNSGNELPCIKFYSHLFYVCINTISISYFLKNWLSYIKTAHLRGQQRRLWLL